MAEGNTNKPYNEYFFQSNKSNGETFVFTVLPNNILFFRVALLIQHDKSHPSIYIVSFTTGENATGMVGKVYGDSSSKVLSSAVLSGNSLTVTYATITYGGCSIFWLN